jgi:hypothetical protein
MSVEILSWFLLSFKDPDMKRIYEKEKTSFFSKVMPVVSFLLVAALVALEVIYRAVKEDMMPN